MPYLLNLLYASLLICSLPYWLYRAATTGKYRIGIWRKLTGAAPKRTDDPRPVVWIHAVSVGEVKLLGPLLRRLLAERPDLRFVLSTTTNTGHAVATKDYPTVDVFYAPLDFSWAVQNAFDALAPRLLVLVELELWPNLLMEARRRGVPVVVVNARLGERSYRGYRRIRRLLEPALASIRWWGAQNQAYAGRISDLVGPSSQVAVTGSMKYEGAPSERSNPKTMALRSLLAFDENSLVVVAGSTQPGEEEVALDAFLTLKDRHPSLRLVLVPRQADRFDEVAAMLARRGISFLRRSELEQPPSEPADVTLVDTIGELAAIWGLADFAFVGGSLTGARGGQSMIEPAAYGVPTCFGPHIWNFQETVDRLLECGGAVQLSSPDDLRVTLNAWLDDPAAAAHIGQRAREFIRSQQGAVAATFAALAGRLPARTSRQVA